jgi:cytochrome c oxidase assembly protein subunit 15
MLDLESPAGVGPHDRSARAHPDWHPWLHAWAVFTVLATFCLLTLGSLVTTMQAGMRDEVGWRTPWHLFTISWEERDFGYLVEHSHRLAGHIVGICTICLAMGTWFIERRFWARVLGFAALLGVGFQGVLGAMRVDNDLQWGTVLRIVHGCTAPLVFALLCTVALVTSSSWCRPAALPVYGVRVRRAAIALAAVVYLQVVFGAVLRHTQYSPVAQRLHLLGAMVVVAATTWLVLLMRTDGPGRLGPRKLLYCLKGLLVLQVLLGVETWLKRFREGLFPGVHQPTGQGEYALQTMHHLGGLLLFATAFLLVMVVCRPAQAMVPATGAFRPEGLA